MAEVGKIEQLTVTATRGPINPGLITPLRAFPTIEPYLARQREWSLRTFGPGKRTGGLCEHIRRELAEIEAAPTDTEEWIDVLILALDGYWRAGGNDIMADLQRKQQKNFDRQWPTATSEDEPVEHIR